MRVLFVTSEAHPLMKTGGLADVSASLPRALQSLGHQVQLLMPAYRNALAMRKLSPKTLQVGRINRELWVEPYINLRLANEVGSSGSPVFAGRDHLAFGILSMGGGNSDAMARPLRPMLEQIAARRQQIADPSLRQTVDKMLKAAGMPSGSR